jgi:hypothetical protein
MSDAHFKVLHFDDDVSPRLRGGRGHAFADSLKATLEREFAKRAFMMESLVVATPLEFQSLLERIDEMRKPDRAVDLVLMDVRLDLQPSANYRGPGAERAFEGVIVAQKLCEIDPNGDVIRRAFLTRSINRDIILNDSEFINSLGVDFLSKDLLQGEPFWARREPFPSNVIRYIEDLAQQRGKWRTDDGQPR